MKIANIYVGSDLYAAGYTDDGQEYHAEVYHIVAETVKGRRFIHKHGFPGCEVYDWCHEDDFGTGFKDVREQAKARAEAACKVINAWVAGGGELDMSHWRETYPVYGSDSYSNEEACEWERRVEEDGFAPW